MTAAHASLVASDQEPARTDAPSPEAVAIVVFHGMGQQVRWDTIDQLVNTLDRHGYVRERSVHTRQAAFTDAGGELRLGRAECMLGVPGATVSDTTVEAHIYESYWAPVTEGAVALRDVVLFLVSAGWAGVRYSVGDFRRHVLGGLRSYGQQRVGLQFALVLAFFAGLVALNLVTAYQVGGYVMANPRPPFAGVAAALAPQTHLLWNLEVVAACFALVMYAAVRVKSRRPAFRLSSSVQTGLWWLFAALVVAVPGVAGVMAIQAWFGVRPAVPLLFGWASETTHALLAWGGALVVSWLAKNLLVQYAGDVMVYVTAHRLSRYHDLRERIQSVAARVATTLYRQGGYKRYVFVGHSLGSVVAYDTLNRLILAQAQQGSTVDKVAALITFGSPLDKTAFVFRSQANQSPVREAMAATVQPLIQMSRPAIPWVNLWSPQDAISGELDFYSLPSGHAASGGLDVVNRRDADADIPLFAHVQFWRGKALADLVARAAAGARADQVVVT